MKKSFLAIIPALNIHSENSFLSEWQSPGYIITKILKSLVKKIHFDENFHFISISENYTVLWHFDNQKSIFIDNFKKGNIENSLKSIISTLKPDDSFLFFLNRWKIDFDKILKYFPKSSRILIAQGSFFTKCYDLKKWLLKKKRLYRKPKYKVIISGEKKDYSKEKLLKYLKSNDLNSIDDSTLLAMVLDLPFHKGLESANKLINKAGSIQYLPDLSIDELLTEKGIGIKKALKIKAMLELRKRIMTPKTENIKIENPQNVFEILKPKIIDLKKEVLWLLTLNSKQILKNVIPVTIGIKNATLAHPREILTEALKRNASFIILAHNHPDENLIPTEDDIEITKQILLTSEIIDVPLIDHIIITSSGYTSLRELGYIPDKNKKIKIALKSYQNEVFYEIKKRK